MHPLIAAFAVLGPVLSNLSISDDPPARAPAAPVPAPHPLITEVLYNVPTGEGTDPNLDGVRSVAGDEFVELINPHDKPVQLLGYTLTDRNPEKKGQLRFTFPAFELPPGGVVVVFNGCESTWASVGPVGDEKAAPGGPNKSFAGAYVFTARISNARTSFANAGDFVLLADSAGKPIHCVSWGAFKEKIPEALLVEVAPLTNRASVQRTSTSGAFKTHLPAESGSKTAFSPGKFEIENIDLGAGTRENPAEPRAK